MGEFIPVVSAVGGLLVGLFGGVFLRRKEYVPSVIPSVPLLPGHEHDLHIKGKRNGRVRLHCLVPGCRFEKYRDE